MNQDFAKRSREAAEMLAKVRVVPVLVLTSVDKALKYCELLTKYGLNAAEITFRTKEAPEIIEAISRHFPELYVGAGTILNVADLLHAFDRGAHFAVAPGLNQRVVKAAIEGGLPFAPGVATPSEIEIACELGCRFMKFFPAEQGGGVNYLKAITAPYKHLGISYMPTGGITAKIAPDYLAIKEVAAVGGTWMCKAADLESDNWTVIEQAIKETAAFAKA